ncbi:MAG: SUF system NifU family Fe-S cluster assembly protein [Coriobacteriales bacterium]|nr:SUF system NifU family Fe-S cluster assembly protein [Coriobacteriales bacterium]
MSNSTTTSIYSAALMDHNAHPDYKYELEDATYSHDGINASCGDEMTLYLKVNNDTNVIEEASFTGHGCAISQASADMMAGLLEGESIEEAKRLSGLFIGMIQGNELSDEDKEDLDEAAELQSISRMPARVKCAELAWRTLNGILAERDKELAAK